MPVKQGKIRSEKGTPQLICGECRAATPIPNYRISELLLIDLVCEECGEAHRYLKRYSAPVTRTSLAQNRESVPNIVPFKRG
jgi:hypothetical protein